MKHGWPWVSKETQLDTKNENLTTYGFTNLYGRLIEFILLYLYILYISDFQ